MITTTTTIYLATLDEEIEIELDISCHEVSWDYSYGSISGIHHDGWDFDLEDWGIADGSELTGEAAKELAAEVAKLDIAELAELEAASHCEY